MTLKNQLYLLDTSVLQELIALNHGMLRTLGVSHESIEAALKVLHSFGFKGKLTGAGCGGCLFALIAPGSIDGLFFSFLCLQSPC